MQIESYTDIGHSAYNQMQKVRNEDVGNVQVDENKEFQQAWEPKSNRCLQLILCDGTQVVRAIEYKPISFFKTDMMPGIKVELKAYVGSFQLLKESKKTGQLFCILVTDFTPWSHRVSKRCFPARRETCDYSWRRS